MKKLNLYIGQALLVNTLIAIGVLTFVMLSASLFKAFDLLARGLSARVIGMFVFYNLPYMLQFTIPLAVLCTTVLVFSRFSADNEVTAMRASGISLWQIITPALLMAAGLAVVCLYLQLQLAPEYRFRASEMRRTEGMRNPLAFLEAGRHVEFPGYVIYVGKRDDANLESIQIYELDESGRLIKDVSARSGVVTVDENLGQIRMTLEEAMVTDVENPKQKPMHVPMRTVTFPLAYAKELNQERLGRKIKYMSVPTILSRIYIYSQRGISTLPLFVELHKRMSMALSPIAFLLIGIPFGIRTRRSETSVGLLVSVGLAMFFYCFLALADSLKDRPALHSEILVWVPNVFYQLGGLYALYKIERR